MTTYFVLYALIGILGFVSLNAQNRFSNIKSATSTMCFMLIMGLLMLRHQSMGYDLGYYSPYQTGYLDSFEIISGMPWHQVLATTDYLNYEYGYILLNKLIGSIWPNRQFFIATCAFLSVYPVYRMALEKSVSPIMSCVIYLALPAFEILFSGLRQGLAIGVCVWSLNYIQEKKPFRFVITVLLGGLLHDATFIFLFAYPLYHLKLDRTFRWVSILLIPLTFLFRYQLFSVLSMLFRYNSLPDNNGAINLLILLTGIYVICALLVEDDERNNGYLNLFLVACICQVFGNIYSTALRVGYYYMPFAILLIPDVVEKMEPRLRVVAKVAVVVFFVAFGISRFYNSSWSMAFPYYWFWQSR